ncbi:LAMI_0B07360g1_1 [Lachancea mirantina]|uniref:RING-type E3 ubiquitin transferase n=1 Tax=Lachancea mirantina TaxID=1230905 RepID=A0A1G4IXC2_9SACH|nr:LAMI_0B07360g1_1 [Lachancea mirantina]
MLVGTRRTGQFSGYLLFTYLTTGWAIYTSVETSISFLDATLKLSDGINLMVSANFMIANCVLLWKLFTRILFGELRLIEYEHIFERLSFTIVNSILVSTMFKEQDFLAALSLASLLIFVKVLHWILSDRLEHVFQVNAEDASIARLLLSKFSFNVAILGLIDVQMIRFCLHRSGDPQDSQNSSSPVFLIYGIDFAMLLVEIVNVVLNASIKIIELRCYQRANSFDNEDFNGLENKFLYEKFVDVLCRFLKTLLHLSLLKPFRMPMILAKDVVWNCIALYQSSKSLWKGWRNNKQLDEKLPNVASQDLDSHEDKMCIVCMDDMLPLADVTSSRLKPKRLPCGHCLHLGCLKNWMERSQTCPICRLPVFDENGNLAIHEATQSRSSEVTIMTTAQQENPEVIVPTADEPQEVNTHSITKPSTQIDTRAIPAGWCAFPALFQEGSTRSFSITAVDGTDIEVSLVDHNTCQEVVEQNSELKRVIIPDQNLESEQEMDTLKRRVSELEEKVSDLTKRARRE